MSYTEEELLPLSGIQHFAYCPRQWGLIHIEKQWAENLGTAEGRIVHNRVDDPYFSESRGLLRVERSTPLVSKELGLYGVADLMEIVENVKGGIKEYTLVEYKRGKPKIDDRDEVQLCAQAVCIEEMRGINIGHGYFYYDMVKRRQRANFTRELRARVKELSAAMHDYFEKGVTPTAEKSSKCRYCSLSDICVPKIGKLKSKASRYLTSYLTALEVEDRAGSS